MFLDGKNINFRLSLYPNRVHPTPTVPWSCRFHVRSCQESLKDSCRVGRRMIQISEETTQPKHLSPAPGSRESTPSMF